MLKYKNESVVSVATHAGADYSIAVVNVVYYISFNKFQGYSIDQGWRQRQSSNITIGSLVVVVRVVAPRYLKRQPNDGLLSLVSALGHAARGACRHLPQIGLLRNRFPRTNSSGN